MIHKKASIVSFIVGLFFVVVAFAPSAHAIDIFANACEGGGDNAVCAARADDFAVLVQNIISTLLAVIGVVAVIMLIIGGFRYVTSNGDSSAITSAKNTILYSVVGIVVAASAFAIVNFVLGRI
jgi:hypothetical protein